MATRAVKIELILDADGAVTGLKTAAGGIVKVGTAADKTGKKVFSLGRIFDVALGNIMANAVQTLQRSIGRLVRAGKDLVGQATEIVETQNKFDAVFGDSAETVQDFLDVFANLAGVTKDVGREFLSTTGFILRGAGFTVKASADMSIAIAKVAGDLTSFTNIPLERSIGAINMALTGEREKLKALGIVLTEAEVVNRAFAQTGKKSASALTLQEKSTASLTLIAEKAAPAIGDLEKTQDSAANQSRQLAAAIGDLRDDFALELLPAVQDTIAMLNEFIKRDDVAEMAKKLGKVVGDALKGTIKVIIKTIDFLEKYRDGIATGAEVVMILTAALVTYTVTVKAVTVAETLYLIALERQLILTRLATVAQRALNLAMKLNPVGAFMTVLVTGAVFMKKWMDKTREATDTTIDFTKATEDAARAVKNLSEAEAQAALQKHDARLDEIAKRRDELAAEKRELEETIMTLATSMDPGAVGPAIVESNRLTLLKEELAALSRETLESLARIAALRALIQSLHSGEDGSDGSETTGGSADAAVELERQQAEELESRRAFNDEVLFLENLQTKRLLEQKEAGTTEFTALAQDREAKLLDIKSRQNVALLRMEAKQNAELIKLKAASGTDEEVAAAEVEAKTLLAAADEDAELLRLDQEHKAALLKQQQEHDAVMLEEAEEFAEKKRQAEEEKAQVEKDAAEAVLKARHEQLKASLAADSEQIKSLGDVVAATLRSTRQIIRAVIAEAVAKALAKIPFPANLILGGAIAASISALFNNLIPSFSKGVTGFGGGMAIVGERGPELVTLSRGTNVITNENTRAVLGGLSAGQDNSALVKEMRLTRKAIQNQELRMRGIEMVALNDKVNQLYDTAGIE